MACREEARGRRRLTLYVYSKLLLVRLGAGCPGCVGNADAPRAVVEGVGGAVGNDVGSVDDHLLEGLVVVIHRSRGVEERGVGDTVFGAVT